MVVDAGDTGVLLHLFLVNVASLRHDEEKLLKRWPYILKAQHCHLTREYKNAYSILAASPNAEGLKTNQHNIIPPPILFYITRLRYIPIVAVRSFYGLIPNFIINTIRNHGLCYRYASVLYFGSLRVSAPYL